MMKTRNITILIVAAALIMAQTFLSCNNPIGLGSRLDVSGPIVEFTAPAPRRAVQAVFYLEGSVVDYTGVDRVLVKATVDDPGGFVFTKQWQYTKGQWLVSEDSGSSWATLGDATLKDHTVITPQWIGNTKNATWKIPVEMQTQAMKEIYIASGEDPKTPGAFPPSGEYMFSVQVWDVSGFSDDNSFKTRVLIYDNDPPSVEITNPYLYPKYLTNDLDLASFSDPELLSLHDPALTDWKDPALIGKFMTQSFKIQWDIEDNQDLWSFDLRFYPYNAANIDDDVATDLPDTTYIYKYQQNLGAPPANPNPALNIGPNGTIIVPNLDGSVGSYNKDGNSDSNGTGYLLNQVTGKTTIRVVASCYDAAGNRNEEKTLGYFIYWPQADIPWITYAEGLKDKADYAAPIDANAYLAYPGGKVTATAFHAQGVLSVTFTVYEVDASYNKTAVVAIAETTLTNDPLYYDVTTGKPVYSTIFPWEFDPPTSAKFYVVEAETKSVNGKLSGVSSALFNVKDLTFPEFTTPSPTGKLWQAINTGANATNRSDDTIVISGAVHDATDIKSVQMVWMNPQSENYYGMVQLEYLRDENYSGWVEAKQLTPGTSVLEGDKDSSLIVSGAPGATGTYPYSPNNRNRLWNLALSPTSTPYPPNPARIQRTYSQSINLLNDLNIGAGNQPLIGQVFLLRVENYGGKCTIIEYAPEGDKTPPKITIEKVRVSSMDTDCIPGTYNQIPKFQAGQTITITGRWEEESTVARTPATPSAGLQVGTYLYPNIKFTVNPQPDNPNQLATLTTTTPGVTYISRVPAVTNGYGTSGTFEIRGTVGQGILTLANLKDGLVVEATIEDIGGNTASHGGAWVVESDSLRFLRISSENEDGTYVQSTDPAKGSIDIFLEFSKPVMLKNSLAYNPQLILNTAGGQAGRATYNKAKNTVESTRQYFTYTVLTDQNTPVGGKLNVTGLSYNNVTLAPNDTGWNSTNDSYPFAFEHTSQSGAKEEIRMTTAARTSTDSSYTTHKIPVNTAESDSEFIFTLYAGKNFVVDTTNPTLSSITVTPVQRYTKDSDIYLIATFSKPVQVGAAVPRLTLNIANTTAPAYTSVQTDPTNVRVSGNTMTFVYKVRENDSTGANELQVTGINALANITDLAGTTLGGTVARTLTNVYVDAILPAVPTVVVRSGATTITGTGTYYNDPLELYFTASGGANLQDRSKIEYSTNNGTDWNTVTMGATAANGTVTLSTIGQYQVIARQVDAAGNASPETVVREFIWDPGTIIERIDSPKAPGTYTNRAGREDDIDIVLHFRRQVKFASMPVFRLNVAPTTDLPNIAGRYFYYNASGVRTAYTAGTLTDNLIYNYQVQVGHNTPTSGAVQNLRVESITYAAGSVTDNTNTVVNAFVAPTLLADTNRLDRTNALKVVTGPLTNNTNPAFKKDTTLTGNATEGNANFQGIHTDSGAYWTTLEIPFDRTIVKGTGNIVITQSATNYRLPAVLTAAQRSKFMTLNGFATLYTPGTNGYIRSTVANSTANDDYADTSTKYILNNTIDTASPPATFGTPAVTLATFASDFRDLEAVTLSANSTSVVIDTDGKTLKIRLTGSNALAVPGATYTIVYPAGFVQDELGTPCEAGSGTGRYAITLDGVAKPFIRVNRSQDTLTRNNTAGDNQPGFTVTPPLTATVRMDCRTPGAAIHYRTAVASTNVNNPGGNFGNFTATAPGDSLTAGNAARPDDPATTVGNNTVLYSAAITIGGTLNGQTGGTNTTAANVQGFQWRGNAIAQITQGGTIVQSIRSEEMAFRTVLTYEPADLREDNDNGTQMSNKDHLWVRGGDAIGSSTVAGFPLTWDIAEMESCRTGAKRAGIRPMYMTNPGSALNTASIWKWVTWEINVTAYIDMLLGRDDASADNEALQYGPRTFAYQRAGWTSFKEQYPLFPGKHRWLRVTNANVEGKGSVNFSKLFVQRQAYIGADITYTP